MAWLGDRVIALRERRRRHEDEVVRSFVRSCWRFLTGERRGQKGMGEKRRRRERGREVPELFQKVQFEQRRAEGRRPKREENEGGRAETYVCCWIEHQKSSKLVLLFWGEIT